MARSFDRGDHRDYHHGDMRSVGIKALKAHLSRYIDLVKKGEVVLITDRDEVVAEIRLPSPAATSRSRWDAALEEEARRGSVKLAKRKKTLLTGPPEPNPSPVDMQKILDELREDRF